MADVSVDTSLLAILNVAAVCTANHGVDGRLYITTRPTVVTRETVILPEYVALGADEVHVAVVDDYVEVVSQ